MSETIKSIGMRKAVKSGLITAQEALNNLRKQTYVSDYAVTWLKNKGAK